MPGYSPKCWASCPATVPPGRQQVGAQLFKFITAYVEDPDGALGSWLWPTLGSSAISLTLWIYMCPPLSFSVFQVKSK